MRYAAVYLFNPKPLDAMVKEHLYDDWDRSSGMNLFVEEWSDLTTMGTAADLINQFSLQDKLGFSSDVVSADDVKGRYTDVSNAFYDIRAMLDDTSIAQLNKDSELANPDGPSYAAGQDELRFGLTFVASWNDVQELRKRFPKSVSEKTATLKTNCVQHAINLLRHTDFGFEPADTQMGPEGSYAYRDLPGLDMLHKAQEALVSCGMPNKELAAAIRAYRTQREKAKALIHGPSGTGSNKGVLNDLIESIAAVAERGSMTSTCPKYIRYAGVFYERVDDAETIRQAYHLPKKMKGVKPCTPSDQTDEEAKENQIWCVFDWKKNLRARYKSRKKALQYKVFMINRGKGGGGK